MVSRPYMVTKCCSSRGVIESTEDRDVWMNPNRPWYAWVLSHFTSCFKCRWTNRGLLTPCGVRSLVRYAACCSYAAPMLLLNARPIDGATTSVLCPFLLLYHKRTRTAVILLYISHVDHHYGPAVALKCRARLRGSTFGYGERQRRFLDTRARGRP